MDNCKWRCRRTFHAPAQDRCCRCRHKILLPKDPWPGQTVTPGPLVASTPSRYNAELVAEYESMTKCQRLLVHEMGQEGKYWSCPKHCWSGLRNKCCSRQDQRKDSTSRNRNWLWAYPLQSNGPKLPSCSSFINPRPFGRKPEHDVP